MHARVHTLYCAQKGVTGGGLECAYMDQDESRLLRWFANHRAKRDRRFLIARCTGRQHQVRENESERRFTVLCREGIKMLLGVG